MSKRWLLGISLVFALLQGSLLPLVFSEGLLVVFSLISRAANLALPLFFSGVVFDLLQNQKLGQTSLIFLGAILVSLILRERVVLQNALTLSLFAVGINMLREKLVFGYVEMLPLIIVFTVSYLIFRTVWTPEVSGKIKI